MMNQHKLMQSVAMFQSTLLMLLASVVFLADGKEALFPKHEALSDELIDYVNSRPNISWRAGKSSRFQSVEELRNLLGTWREPRSLRNQRRPTINHDTVNAQIPAEFDSRVNWPHCETIKEIRDQSSCGSCWAFGAVTAMSDRVCIHSKKDETNVRISATDLLSCCHSCGFGCVGGWVGPTWDFWRERGLVTGAEFGDKTTCRPYPFPRCDHHSKGKYGPCPKPLYATPQCEEKCTPESKKDFKQDLIRAKSSYNIEGMANIQLEIMTNGPVEAAFNVYADFGAYEGGVYEHVTGELLGGHAIRIIGWGVEDKTNKRYWLIANSWNEQFGEKGFFRMLRGENHCGIEGDVSGGIPMDD